MTENNKHLIITIHGIGDAQPGETADAILSGIKGAGTVNHETLWLPEYDQQQSKEKHQFCSVLRRVDIPGKKAGTNKTLIAEVNWSDLSAPAKNVLETIKNLFLLAIGLGDIALRALNRSPKILNYLSKAISHLIKGPILSGNCALILITVIQAVLVSSNRNIHYQITTSVTASLLFVGFLMIIIGLVWWQRSIYRIFNGWFIFFGVLLIGVTVFTSISLGSEYEWTVKKFLASSLGINRCDFECLSGLHWYGAFFLVMLQGAWLMAWIVLVIMGSLTLIIRFGNKKNRKSLWLGYVATSLMLWLPTLFMPTMWVAVSKVLPQELIPDPLMQSGVRLMGLQWSIVLLILISMIVVYFMRQRGSSEKKQNRDHNAEPNYPRVIIAKPIAIILGVIPFIVLCIIVIWFFELSQYSWLVDWLNKGRAIAISSVSLFIFTASFFIKSLATGTDIGLDIAGYFKKNKKGKTELRNKIQHRLKITFDVLKRLENPDYITLVSHSQGTVFAIKEMAYHLNSQKCLNKQLRLITMGSPYTHIYQHYFPEFEKDARLPDDDMWFNFYRRDDFVGTIVNGANNNDIGTGGHSGYWSDPDVINCIIR